MSTLSKIHRIKAWPQPFQQVWEGNKVHEVRRDDRDYRVGDGIVLQEYDPNSQRYSGREIHATITYKTEAGTFGLPPDVCVLSIRVVESHTVGV